MIAAPIAAWLVRVVPAQLLGAAVGGVIVLTNARTLMRAAEVGGNLRVAVYGLVALGWVVAVAYALRALRRTRAGAAAPEQERPLTAVDG